MKETRVFAAAVTSILLLGGLAGCLEESQVDQEQAKVEQQQSQYAIGQPIPAFDWSLERHLLIELYNLRNQRVATHSVWRSDHGVVEGDCPSMGYGLPYDTSLTNPWQGEYFYSGGVATVGQPEPNGVFASQNTAATWVMCVGEAGSIEPVYVETKVTVYPYPVAVDYATDRVTKAGEASVTISRGGS